MEAFVYLPLVIGSLAWLIGGNAVLYRAAKREGLHWPTFPPLTKLTLSDFWVLVACLLACFAGFAATLALTSPR